ncbi:SCO family protein [Aquimarina macrocephali]|uniref:SCO family protein n=1 Tax=Aquimarina macrocephali TaxID=666563 RepID=UPI000467C86E|nr:SCO family protein [Aquimarina macrocephali]
MIKQNILNRKTFVFFVIVTAFTYGCKQASKKELPIYNPADFNPKLVDKGLQAKDRDHKVINFSLINQNGDTITQKDYKSKIYVVDFFFTKCPSICPIMTNNMAKLQHVFKDDPQIKLLSISVTPEIDSISILKTYATKNKVIDSKWNITTGNKKHIYNLARKSYFAVVNEGDGGLQDFIHTPNFVLIDKKKQIRGIYDGTNDKEIERLMDDIGVLKND